MLPVLHFLFPLFLHWICVDVFSHFVTFRLPAAQTVQATTYAGSVDDDPVFVALSDTVRTNTII